MRRYYNRVFIILLLTVVGLLVVWRAQQQIPKTTNQLSVAVSFYPLYFLAEQIGGDKVRVTNLTPAGAEPHDYELTAQDMARLENSRLLLLNGGGVEVWGNNIQKNLDPAKTLVVVVGQGLTTRQLIEDNQAKIDPHIWLSPALFKIMAGRVEQALSKIDPAATAYYQKNLTELIGRLDQLILAYKQGLKNCQQKNIIVAHAAFAYLADDYGLNQVAIAGLSPDAEPSSKQLADIARFARSNKVKYIFFESLVSPKLAQTIAQEIGAQTLVLNPLEGLTGDQLAQGQDYFTVMQQNLLNLQQALQCSP